MKIACHPDSHDGSLFPLHQRMPFQVLVWLERFDKLPGVICTGEPIEFLNGVCAIQLPTTSVEDVLNDIDDDRESSITLGRILLSWHRRRVYHYRYTRSNQKSVV